MSALQFEKLVYRWATFNTYDQGSGNWMMGNDASMYGGVTPTNWTDNNATAGQMSTNLSTLATLFSHKGIAASNANVISDTDYYNSSTNGQIAAALFRVQNTTGNPITWSSSFYYSSYSSWGEIASVAVNGSNVWTSTANGVANGPGHATLSIVIPANGTSTVIFTSAFDTPSNTRSNQLGFDNNCLALPTGLTFVDDLVDPIGTTYAINSPNGFQFDVDPRSLGAGQLVQGTNNTFDGLNALQVNGTNYFPTSTSTTTNGGQVLVTGTQSLSSLLVRREITVPNVGSEDFARTLDIFTNPSGSAITTTVTVVGNLGSDAATTVFATSDGDLLVEPTDLWFGTDDADGTGTPAVIHLLHGPDGLAPIAVQVLEDNVQWTYSLTVPAGETRRLASFTVLGTTRAQAIAAVNALLTPAGFGGQAAAFLTQAELTSTVNFTDATAPTVLGTNPSLTGAPFERGGHTSLQIAFSEDILGGSTAANFELLSGGADRVIGTGGDDTLVALAAAYSGGATTLTFADLPANEYRFAIQDTITDQFGNALNGGSDYVQMFSVVDTVGPKVTLISPAQSTGTYALGTSSFQVSFDEVAVGAASAANYQLRGVGADGLLGTADDSFATISPSYAGTTATLTFPGLGEGVYRIVVQSTITDLAGNALDGDANGTSGGDWSRDFVVTSSSTIASVYRWATFNTFDQGSGVWMMNNDALMYGGVTPSNWTDGNATAGQMSTNLSTLATLFTHKSIAASNANVISDTDYTFSSTNGQIAAALFRVQNTTSSPITWSSSFYYSSFANYSEIASVAVNGSNVWTSTANGVPNGPGHATLSIVIPANGTSTVIFTSAFDAPNGTRSNQLGFDNNCLALPTGLTFVDDLPATAPYRWATFSTYDQASGNWMMGNDAAMYGGVTPLNWTDNSATAGQMSTNLNTLSTLFTNKGYAGANANVGSETYYYASSTNGQITAALFRVQNTTGSPITWSSSFYYSSYSSWGEIASVAVNGSSVWTSTANGVANGPGHATLSIVIPANGTSTVIFTSAYDAPNGTRSNQLGFDNNCLTLPSGLTFVDDLPATAPYRWANFNTFDQSINWMMNNDASMYGGVTPLNWTDNNATAGQMSTTLSTLATLFTNKGYAGANANISSETDYTYSSTNGQITAALFRVQNATGSPITWSTSFYYSSFASYSEIASVAINGSNVWTSTANGVPNGPGHATLSIVIPANGTSTVIFTSAYDAPNGTRSNQLGFDNNCLTLPTGLTFVDDLVDLIGTTYDLTSPNGFQFDIDPRNLGAGQLIQGTNNAFDGLNRLQVDGADYYSPSPSSTADGGRTLVTASQALSGLVVQREITVPDSGAKDFARTLDVFNNPTGAPITTIATVVGNLGSDAATTVFATSDGDLLIEPTDLWFGTDDADGTGTPAVIHLLHGPDGLAPIAVQVLEDNVQWTYSLTVPTGETRRLATFTVLGTTRAQAIAAVNTLLTPAGFGGQAAAFLTQTELTSIVNFSDVTAPTVVSTNPSLSGGPFERGGHTSLQITFSEDILGGSTATNFKLLSGGADRVIGTGGDDTLVALAAAYTGGTTTLTFADLPANEYRFTVQDTITDLFGNLLNGGSDYVQTFSVVDTVAPKVTLISPAQSAGSYPLGTSSFQVMFDEAMAGATSAANYQLRGVGADGLLGTADDSFATISPSYAGTTATLAFPGLAEGVYRIVMQSTVTDLAGNALDGDANGTAGGDWSRDFVVTASSAAAVYRWATFNTYDQGSGVWMMGNDPLMYGGVTPSNWTDGNATAGQMSTNLSTLATLFTHKGIAESNANISSETDYTYSSTNGQITAALFRVQNTTGSAITWSTSFYYSSFAGYNEIASVAVNGSNVWTSTANGVPNGPGHATLSIVIPANGTSTVIFASAYDTPNGTRSNQLGFDNNCLALPIGLTFVDDLVDPIGMTYVLNSPNGFQFDIDPRNMGAGQLIQGRNNAFDGLNRLQVNGADYYSPSRSSTADGGRTLVTGSQTLSGLVVQREITVPDSGAKDFARTIDVYSNPTGSAITASVKLVGNLGSDALTTVFATSDGDLLVEPTDLWFGTDDGDGT